MLCHDFLLIRLVEKASLSVCPIELNRRSVCVYKVCVCVCVCVNGCVCS